MYACMYVCILRADVQPTLDPYAKQAHCANPGGEESGNDVCECVRD